MKNALVVIVIASIVFFAIACDKVTYPKEKLGESVAKLCKEEYNIDIDVSITGKTLAIYLPITNLFDVTLNLSEEAQNKIQDVLLSASRIVLSTDADVQFYCVITQDIRLPEIQLIIIKYTEDVKRAFYHDISRGEYFKRTIIDINENPQAKKEQAISDVFDKMDLEKEWQDKVMDDFFRSPPSSLEGIGYWNGKFYMKDITLEEFLAQQMANRIKMKFREKEELRKYAIRLVTGKFVGEKKPKFFLIGFRSETLLFVVDRAERTAIEKEIFANMFEEVSAVIYGYKFEDFDLIKIIEENYNEKLLTSKENIYLFKRRKIGISTILEGVS